MTTADSWITRIAIALAVGAIMTIASEMLFYATPEQALQPFEIPLTWLFYAYTSYVCLALGAWLGVRGWVSLFLLGSIFGWIIEGVVVTTVYGALPFTIPFTAMSWHALISAVLVFAVVRNSAHWRLSRQILLLVALGLSFGLWAQFWVIERGTMPPDELTYAYLVGLGLAVPFANIALDHLPQHYPYKRRELVILAALTTLMWAARMLTTLNPAYLVLPAVILPTIAILRRRSTGTGLTLPPKGRAGRHMLFLITPLITAILATEGWKRYDWIESNWPIALLSTAIALGIYATAAYHALRKPA